jgi:hypothetical protein
MTQLGSANIHVDETPALTRPTEVRARARRLKRERGLDSHRRGLPPAHAGRGDQGEPRHRDRRDLALAQGTRQGTETSGHRPVAAQSRRRAASGEKAGDVGLAGDLARSNRMQTSFCSSTAKKCTTRTPRARASRTSSSPSSAMAPPAMCSSPSSGSTPSSRTTRRSRTPRACSGEAPMTPMVSATIDTGALRHNLGARAELGAALARHGGHQGERLRPWIGRSRSRARGRGFLRGGAGRRGPHAARRRDSKAHRAARGRVRSSPARMAAAARASSSWCTRRSRSIAARAGRRGRALQGLAQARQRHESPRLQGRGVRRGMHRLEEPDHRFEIAWWQRASKRRVSFSTPSYIAATFRKRTGMSVISKLRRSAGFGSRRR